MEKSGFFNAMKVGEAWDRVYTAENFAEYFATFIANGVFPNPSTGVQVIGTDRMNVIIKPGKAWINGFIYINTDDLIIPIDVADGVLNRTDKIVLKYDVAKREIRAVVKKGQFASNPISPELQRDTDAYELALADIRVNAGAISITQADITDLRLNKEMCGIVHGTVDQVDTTAIFNQFQSWYSQTKSNYDNDITKWTTDKKQAFNTWYTQNTQLFLSKMNIWYDGNNKDFGNWFNNIKTQLDGDVAGKLLNKINSIPIVKADVNEPVGLRAGDFWLKELT